MRPSVVACKTCSLFSVCDVYYDDPSLRTCEKGFFFSPSIFKELSREVSVYKLQNSTFAYMKGVIIREYVTSLPLPFPSPHELLSICYQSAWKVGRWERDAVVVPRDHIKGTRLM